jgi:imidazolonepropionase-like amidohydrolase
MTPHAFAAGAALIALLAVPGRRVAPQGCDPLPLLVRNTNVWTPDGIQRNRDVTFREGRVATIEPARARPERGIATIDGSGDSLLPGFVDLHLHLTIPGGLPGGAQRATYLQDTAGRQLLRSGVTSGRLHLATIEEATRLKSRSADPCALLPRLQVGGPGLSGAAERDYGNFQGARSREDAVAKIERSRAAGVDWVAIHDADRFAPGVLEALAGAARSANLRIMAAGSTPAEIAAALSIRPDTLDYFDRSDSPRYADELLAAMRAHANLVLVPTPGVPFRTAAYAKAPALLESPDNFELLTDADRAFVTENGRKDLAGEPARSARVLQSLPVKFGQLRRLGLPMAIGSDAGSPLHYPANAIWWELEAWRSLGASHREALTAATEAGARLLGPPYVGRLTPGSRADFILYRGDVERGAFDGARVVAVGKGGVRVR